MIVSVATPLQKALAGKQLTSSLTTLTPTIDIKT